MPLNDQVERQVEDSPSNEWQIIGSPISRETRDLDLCDFPRGQHHLLKMTAMSEAGATTVLYRVMPPPLDAGDYFLFIQVNCVIGLF